MNDVRFPRSFGVPQDDSSRMIRGIFALLLTIVTGCATKRAAPSVVRPQIEQTTVVNVLGTSVNGAPIPIERFGTGSINVLILGGIHGDEPESVELTTRLITHLRQHPDACAGRSVLVIAVANPDGYLARKRSNANRVDLNRNFPATNFKPSRRTSTRPADQPETRALLRAIEETQPRLIISIHSMPAPDQCNNYDGPAEAIARLMSQHNGYRVTPTMGYPTPGSMGSYCGSDRGIPIITLELPRGAARERIWRENRDALLAAIAAAK
jgi:murein peptide amidase A